MGKMSLNLTNELQSDVTVVSNIFIDEYMKDANDAEVKVYLYLLRRMGSGLSVDVPAIADAFEHTERDVLKALDYWAKRGLMSLEYDEGKLSGIRMLSLKSKAKAAAKAEVKAEPAMKAAPSLTVLPDEEPEMKINENITYSRDQIRTFKDNAETAQIVFIAEQYLKRTLSAGDIQALYFIYDELKFTCEMTDYLLQYCIDRGKDSFSYIKKVAINWAQAGITTPKQAREFAGTRYEKYVYTVLKSLGKTSIPQPAEAEIVIRWRKDYGFELDIILEACARTVLATDSHRLEYCDKILKNWKDSGIRDLSDVSRADTEHKKNKPGTGTKNGFGKMEQNDYDFDALEKLLSGN